MDVFEIKFYMLVRVINEMVTCEIGNTGDFTCVMSKFYREIVSGVGRNFWEN